MLNDTDTNDIGDDKDTDTSITIIAMHKIKPDVAIEQVKKVIQKFCDKVKENEPDCLQYIYSIKIVNNSSSSNNDSNSNADQDEDTSSRSILCCRETYTNVDGLLHHLSNVGPLFTEFVSLVDFDHCDIHCPANQVDAVWSEARHRQAPAQVPADPPRGRW